MPSGNGALGTSPLKLDEALFQDGLGAPGHDVAQRPKDARGTTHVTDGVKRTHAYDAVQVQLAGPDVPRHGSRPRHVGVTESGEVLVIGRWETAVAPEFFVQAGAWVG